MKLRIYLTFAILTAMIISCSAPKETVKETYNMDSLHTCCPGGAGLLRPPINTGRKDTLAMQKDEESYKLYFSLQTPSEQLKDHAPCVEINPNKDNPRHERLWFTSSRLPMDKSKLSNKTNLTQQIYYIDRIIEGEGACPSEGWGDDIHEFKVETNFLDDKVDFNALSKGAVAIAGDTMIVSASHYLGNNRFNSYNDLYILVKNKEDNKFELRDKNVIENNVIDVLCSDTTWESQPTLSKDCDDMFFVSNRALDGEEKSGDMNIYYSHRDNYGQWGDPEPVTAINTDGDEITPQLSPDERFLYFASNSSDYESEGGYDIYVIEFRKVVDENGNESNTIGTDFEGESVNANEFFKMGCGGEVLKINDEHDQKYPYLYYNEQNYMNDGKAIFWSSNNPQGYQNFDIYACSQQQACIDLLVYVMDACSGEMVNDPLVKVVRNGNELSPVEMPTDNEPAKFRLNVDKHYEVFGGSNYFESKPSGFKTVETKWLQPKYVVDQNSLLNSTSTIDERTEKFSIYDAKRVDKEIIGKVIDENTEEEIVERNGFPRVVRTQTKTYYDSKKIVSNDSISVRVISEETVEEYGSVYVQTGQGCDYSDCDKINTEELRAYPAIVKSNKMLSNQGIRTPYTLTKNLTIRDTVYLSKCQKRGVGVRLVVDVIDKCQPDDPVKEAVFEVVEVGSGKKIQGIQYETKDEFKTQEIYILELGKEYKVFGGSMFDGVDTEKYDNAILLGYLDAQGKPCPPVVNNPIINGAEVKSEKTRIGVISTKDVVENAIFYDTVYVSKALNNPPPCRCFSNDLTEHENLAWFQTAFWELNLPETLPDHLDRLEKGFDIEGLKDCLSGNGSSGCYDSKTLYRSVSDYYDGYFSDPMFPVVKSDKQKYSIANGRWIELHPNNMYWGVRPTYSKQINKERITNLREKRIKDYEDYANKADINLTSLVNVINEYFIPIMEQLKALDSKYSSMTKNMKLLVQINGVSDERPVKRGWYIGDEDIEYISAYYDPRRVPSPNMGGFTFNKVHIPTPNVNENRKSVSVPKRTHLGSKNRTLSDIRAWYGYKEIINRLKDKPNFKPYLSNNAVYLPEIGKGTEVDNAEIIIFAKGFGHKNIQATKPYPYEAKSGSGYYDYDDVRRIEVDVSFVNYDDGIVGKFDFCKPYDQECEKWEPLIKINPTIAKEYQKKINRSVFGKQANPIKIGDEHKENYDDKEDPGGSQNDQILIVPREGSDIEPVKIKPTIKVKPEVKESETSNIEDGKTEDVKKDKPNPINNNTTINKTSPVKSGQKAPGRIETNKDMAVLEKGKTNITPSIPEGKSNYTIIINVDDRETAFLYLTKLHNAGFNKFEFEASSSGSNYQLKYTNINSEEDAKAIIKQLNPTLKEMNVNAIIK